MRVKFLVGPTHKALRPLKYPVDALALMPDSPVYPRLVEYLLNIRDHTEPDGVARYVCAALSAWSYSDARTVARVMARLGLPENRCRLVEVVNHALFVHSTAYLVQSKCGRVTFLAYRGTDPFDFSTWAVSYDVAPMMMPVRDNAHLRWSNGTLPVMEAATNHAGAARVHSGFYRNQRATWSGLTPFLERAAYGQSIEKEFTEEERASLRPPSEETRGRLFITGHSMGGAMALLASYRLCADPTYATIRDAVEQVYTFAQPMVGNEGFKTAWEKTKLDDRLFCHNYRNDVVPHLPPSDTRKFVHVGKHYWAVRQQGTDPSLPEWHWSTQRGNKPCQARHSTALLGGLLGFLAAPFQNSGHHCCWAGCLEKMREGARRALKVLPRFSMPGCVSREKEVCARQCWYSFYDHMPQRYLACSRPKDVLSEFGDDF